MAQINTLTDLKNNLTIHTIRDEMKLHDIIYIVEKYYKSAQTKNLIWNLLDASLSHINSNEANEGVKITSTLMKIIGKEIPGSKTAILVSKSVDFGICRIYHAHAEYEVSHMEYKVFYNNIEDAKTWMGISIE